MSQATRYWRPAEPNDLSDLTYTVPRSIAHEILHRRIPLLTDIMAFTVGIIHDYKRLRTHNGGALHRQYRSANLWGLFGEMSCSEVKRAQDSDSGVEPSRQTCIVCYSSIVKLTFEICRILVLLFTPGQYHSEYNRPFITRMPQVDVQRLRDALSDIYHSGKMISTEELYCLSDSTAKWCLGGRLDPRPVTRSTRFRDNPRPFEEFDIRTVCPWAVDGLPEALQDCGYSHSYPGRRHQDVDPDIYLQLLGDAENKLAREMVTPCGISPYLEGTVELSPTSCAGGGWSEVYEA